MGIGMFEGREYIRSLDGDISVESAVDRGTAFFVEAPDAGVAGPPVPERRPFAEGTGSEAGAGYGRVGQVSGRRPRTAPVRRRSPR